MPRGMQIIFGIHLLFGLMLQFFNLNPTTPHEVNGKLLTYSEWWLKGFGFIVLGISAILIATAIGSSKPLRGSSIAFPFM